jgi:hypothetical protein
MSTELVVDFCFCLDRKGDNGTPFNVDHSFKRLSYNCWADCGSIFERKMRVQLIPSTDETLAGGKMLVTRHFLLACGES